MLKQIPGDELVEVVRIVANGGSLISDEVRERLLGSARERIDGSNPLAELTKQELAVFDLVGEGLTNRQIAARLYLAEKTVKNYVTKVLSKLGMQRRTQAVVLAAQLHSRAQTPAE